MKKIFNLAIAAFALLSLGIACSKEVASPDDQLTPGENPEQVTPSTGKQITITATLSDALTKVSFDATFDGSHKPTGMAHVWQAGDKLQISKADNSESFELELDPASDGLATGVFTGTQTFTDASYNVSVIPVGGPFVDGNTQIQASDGSTAHLQFVASATGVTDLMNIELSETSNIIGIIAKLPAGAAEKINELEIETSVDDFATSTKLNILLTNEGDEDDDDILNIYANVPASWGIPANTKMFLRFKSSDTGHKVYTRYQEFATAATIIPGKFNYIKMNCSNIDKFAGKDDDGTSAHPYLIADPYQLAAINSYASTSATTCIKVIADIDMKGITHTPINSDVASYAINVDFDGNNKTISNLGKSLFYVFKGSIHDLTLDKSDVTSRGVFAEYCQGSGHTITDVTITNGKVVSTSSNVGGLIGQINNGTSGNITATITNCTVSGTDVTGAGVVGGFVGFANELVSISGCKYTGGTVQSSGMYCGGFLGSTKNVASVITNCQVEDATVKTTRTDDARCGGFVGQLQVSCQIKGCTVGTDFKKVTVSTPNPADDKVLNSGGFVGVNYGTISKNGDVRTKAYVKITSGNTKGQQLNLGGFVGFGRGTIEYCDAEVDMTSLKGQYIGGFAGYITYDGTVIDNCSSSGDVTGNNYTGGFVGVIDNASSIIRNCSSSGTVVAGSSIGGFAGALNGSATLTNNSTSCTVSGITNIGAFIGATVGGTISKCASTGTTVTASGNVCGGFIGWTDGGTQSLSVSDCYSTTNLSGATRKRGGLFGYIKSGTVSITRCYATGTISNNFETGGLIGFANDVAITLTKSAAWNSSVTASSIGATNWSTAAIVGVSYLTSTLTDNYRNPAMALTAYWGNTGSYGVELTTSFQHPNVDSSHPLTDWDGNAVTHANVRPYNGKCEAGKTLSQLASTTLGWDSSVWDFTGDLPTLK